jgi:hypothetical protein
VGMKFSFERKQKGRDPLGVLSQLKISEEDPRDRTRRRSKGISTID